MQWSLASASYRLALQALAIPYSSIYSFKCGAEQEPRALCMLSKCFMLHCISILQFDSLSLSPFLCLWKRVSSSPGRPGLKPSICVKDARMALNFWSSSYHFPNAVVTGTYYHPWLQGFLLFLFILFCEGVSLLALAMLSLYRPSWPQTHRDQHASVSWVLN